MRKRSIAGLSLAAVAVLVLVISQMPSARFGVLRTLLPLTETLTVKSLGGGAYWVSGGIGNTAFVIGNTSVIAIDAQMFIPTARKQLAEIAKITPKPVKVMVLTHSDPDHINGLPAFPGGMEIIAQDNAKHVIEALGADLNSNGFPPSPEIRNYVPTRTVKNSETTVLDGVPVVLIHTGPAHTDGDLAIYLPMQKLVFAGDLLTPAIGPYPGIHLDKHGSSLGMFASLRAILALDADTYIPGHGDVLNKGELSSRLKAAEERRGQIKALFDQGKTLSEIKATLNDVPLKGAAARFPTFIETTYQELVAEKGSGGLKK
jgi:glyoxylase-like metal-dependent hydrolase (beta-lactamase superfamily II)